MLMVLGAIALWGCAGPETAREVKRLDGFSSPESALFDAVSQSWFVSNVAGTDAGDGSISRVSADGQTVDYAFVTGLNDPKGQRIDGRTLFVTDDTQLVAIDLRHPDQRRVIEIPGSQFLNDIAIDPATHAVYVSDTFANTIYRVDGDQVSIVLQDAALEAPNGLLFERGSLLIASVGPDLDPVTFATSAPGRIFSLDLASGVLKPLTERFGALDGIERDGASLLVSDTFVGVYEVTPDGETKLIDNASTGLINSADIGFDPLRRRIAVPELFGTHLAFFDLEREHRL